jgi:hypothetical protein
VDNTETGDGSKLGPVDRTAQPLAVGAQQGIAGGARVHDGVGEHDGAVAHGVAGVGVLRVRVRVKWI